MQNSEIGKKSMATRGLLRSRLCPRTSPGAGFAGEEKDTRVPDTDARAGATCVPDPCMDSGGELLEFEGAHTRLT